MYAVRRAMRTAALCLLAVPASPLAMYANVPACLPAPYPWPNHQPPTATARFLRYSPYSEMRSFKQLIKDKIAEKPEVGYKFLQAVLQVGVHVRSQVPNSRAARCSPGAEVLQRNSLMEDVCSSSSSASCRGSCLGRQRRQPSASHALAHCGGCASLHCIPHLGSRPGAFLAAGPPTPRRTDFPAPRAMCNRSLARWLHARSPCAGQAVLLRRTKQSTINGEPIIKLPGREQALAQQTFSKAEAAFYTRVGRAGGGSGCEGGGRRGHGRGRKAWVCVPFRVCGQCHRPAGEHGLCMQHAA